MLGNQLIKKINCLTPGHKLNQMFMTEIFKDKKNYTIEKAISNECPDKIYSVLSKDKSLENLNNVA